MSIAKFLLCCLFCAVLVFAQQPSEEKSFDKLRGFAYNPYGTLGAAPTIADILQKPSDIYGHKFVYIDPASNSGYSVFDLAGSSVLMGFDRSLTFGFAKSFYGFSLNIYPNWTCLSNDGYECTNYSEISEIGLNFSMPLGNSILYAHAGRKTATVKEQGWQTIYNSEQDSLYSIYKDNIFRYFFKEAFIGITGGNTLVWDLMLSFDYLNASAFFRHGNSLYALYKEYNTKFLFDFGYKFSQSDRIKFIAGLNNELSHQYLSSTYDDEYNLRLSMVPNFLGEVALSEHLLAFVGARHGVNFKVEFKYNLNFVKGEFLEEEATYDSHYERSPNMEVDNFSIKNSGSGAYTGLRYERKDWAIETYLQSDAIGKILDGENPFISLGIFIWLAL
jgi:hypothetical protein